MHFRFNLSIRIISILVLVLFCWGYLGIYEIAYAASNGSETKAQKSGGGLQKAIEDTEEILADAVTDTETKKTKVKAKKAEINALDNDIKRQFQETENKIKESGLPSEILDRHRDFVKRYEDNLNELKTNLDNIEKAKTEAEAEEEVEKAKTFIEKVKPPSRHTPLDPDKLPPRLKKLKHIKTSWLKKLEDLLIPSAHAAEPPSPSSSDLSETIETSLTQEIRDLAAELKTPVAIYEFVRNNFKYEPYSGSVKGAGQTLKEGAGNEWDLASLLIALYRANGIPARYVVGTVEIPIDKAKSWLGVEDADMAASLLYSEGRPTTSLISGGKISAIRTQQVWVEAYVPFLYSRGATSGLGDTWVDLDPSFKTQTVSQALTLTGVPTFNQADYLSTFQTESPLDFYNNQLQGFLDANASGYISEALGRNLDIDIEYYGILIGQLPYTSSSITGRYSEVPDSFRQKFTITITNNSTGESILTYTALLPKIIDKRLTLSYTPATVSDEATITAYGGLYSTPPYLIQLKPQIKLEGQIVAEGNAIGAAQQQTMEFYFKTPTGTDIVQNTIVAGEYYAIALNAYAGSGSHQEIIDRAQKLAAIQDTINLNDPLTIDDRLGELLYLSAMLYHQNLNMAERKMAAISRVIDIKEVSEMMYFLTTKVDYFFGIPKKMTPVAITADMDRNSHLIIPIDGDLNRIKPYAILEGNHASYLEHNATEKIYKTEALSAVKGIQLAHDQNIPVHTITAQNINTLLPTLQISEQVKTDIQNAIHSGWEAIVPESNLTVGDWIGVGYILQNPENGEAYYRVEGGHGGAVLVRTGYVADLFHQILADFAKSANVGAVRDEICYPSEDNIFYNGKDTCFNIVLPAEIEEDPNLCGPSSQNYTSTCQKHYAPANPKRFQAPPLIDINGHDAKKLTKHISVKEWKSPDGSKYMRAGTTILSAIEAVVIILEDTGTSITVGFPSGGAYRSTGHNLKKSPPNSPNSYHVDGVAADFTLYKGTKPIDQCVVQNEIEGLTLGFGLERYHKGKSNAVHAATPVPEPVKKSDCQ